MIRQRDHSLADLFEADETAWLEATADLIRKGLHGEIDYPHLEEYLCDMARRDRREVESRLTILIAHILKWVYQPDRRTSSWRGTIVEHQQELRRMVERGVLRNHAESVMTQMYRDAVERAAAQTDLPAEAFAADCPYSLDDLLAYNASGHLD